MIDFCFAFFISVCLNIKLRNFSEKINKYKNGLSRNAEILWFARMNILTE
jgi:hypothetical protein